MLLLQNVRHKVQKKINNQKQLLKRKTTWPPSLTKRVTGSWICCTECADGR